MRSWSECEDGLRAAGFITPRSETTGYPIYIVVHEVEGWSACLFEYGCIRTYIIPNVDHRPGVMEWNNRQFEEAMELRPIADTLEFCP